MMVISLSFLLLCLFSLTDVVVSSTSARKGGIQVKSHSLKFRDDAEPSGALSGDSNPFLLRSLSWDEERKITLSSTSSAAVSDPAAADIAPDATAATNTNSAYQKCYDGLQAADVDFNQSLKREEYMNFLQTLTNDDITVENFLDLPLLFVMFFYTTACWEADACSPDTEPELTWKISKHRLSCSSSFADWYCKIPERKLS